MRTLFDRIPSGCSYAEKELDNGHVLCTMRGSVWVNCRASVCGEEPQCAWEPLDNSEAAKARRLAWIRENGLDEPSL